MRALPHSQGPPSDDAFGPTKPQLTPRLPEQHHRGPTLGDHSTPSNTSPGLSVGSFFSWFHQAGTQIFHVSRPWGFLLMGQCRSPSVQTGIGRLLFLELCTKSAVLAEMVRLLAVV